MRRTIGLLFLILGMLPAAAGAPLAAYPGAETPATDALTGQLLVADPDLGDPHFQHTIVLIVQHDETGALGLVLNRPYGKAPAAELMRKLGFSDKDAKGEIELCYGGPVQPEIGMVVHSPDYSLPATQRLTPDLSVTSDPAILHDIAAGKGPHQAIAVLGYSGWAPGQLESELTEGAWFTIPADPTLIFGPDPATKWQQAVKRRGVDL